MRALVLVFVMMAVTSAQEPAFEVASVKVVAERRGGVFGVFVPGEVRFDGAPLRGIVPSAFGVPTLLWELKVLPGPDIPADWWRSQRFQVHGKGDPSQDARAMLRTLLKERFGMRYHTEVRQVPVYALTVKNPGTLGPRLTATAESCRAYLARGGKRGDADSPKRGDLEVCWPVASPMPRYVGAGTMSDLIEQALISATYGERPVIDATGLAGNFIWDLAMQLELGAPDLVFAALESQLGLKLERRTGPWEVFVIDAIQMPTPN